jgi:hypothetical protein
MCINIQGFNDVDMEDYNSDDDEDYIPPKNW